MSDPMVPNGEEAEPVVSAEHDAEAPAFEWEVQGNYGQGWEMVCTEDNPGDARQRLREYNENEPQYLHRVKKVRSTQ